MGDIDGRGLGRLLGHLVVDEFDELVEHLRVLVVEVERVAVSVEQLNDLHLLLVEVGLLDGGSSHDASQAGDEKSGSGELHFD